MARDFDGTNDAINFGSHTSIDDGGGFGLQKTIAGWVAPDVTGGSMVILAKWAATPSQQGWFLYVDGDLRPTFENRWSTGSFAGWRPSSTSITLSTAGPTHLAITYDGGSTANDAVIYVDGVSVAVERLFGGGVSSVAVDDAQDLLAGLRSNNSFDFDGRLTALAYDNALWTEEQVRRHMHWGRPGGPVAILHPLITGKLDNEGTATADGSVSGTVTVAPSAEPIVRPGTALMGMGVGW